MIGIIGGSGFYSLNEEDVRQGRAVETPFSNLPVFLTSSTVENKTVWFIPRHGVDHTVPPHLINYRANLWALKEAGASRVIAVNAVGGITEGMPPGALVIPDQIIDYTWGREHTFVGSITRLDNHIDFSKPYDSGLANTLKESAARHNLEIVTQAVYGCTQGPRLESAAEIVKLKRDGCDIVGMTAMPEASLARELGMNYASIALVVNWAAGILDEPISVTAMEKVMEEGARDIRKILMQAINSL